MSAFYDIRADGTYTQSASYRPVETGTIVTLVHDGTWSESSPTVVFSRGDGYGDTPGTRTGDRLTVDGGLPWVYLRE